MYFQYGNYAHAVGEVDLRTSCRTVFDAADRPSTYVERWDLYGQLQDVSPAALTALANSMQAYYGQPAYQAGLFISAGVPSHNYWIASNTISGIRLVAPPGYPDGTRIQFVNARDYIISLEAEFVYPGSRNLTEFHETLEMTGNGGPRIVTIELRRGKPVTQQVSESTPVVLIQHGSATGRFRYPYEAVPPPLFPNYLNGPEVRPIKEGARFRGNSFTDWALRWNYVMILPKNPGNGINPHLQPRYY